MNNTNLNDDDLTFMDMMQIQRDEFAYCITDTNGRVTKQIDIATALLIRTLIRIETFVKKIINSKETTRRLMQRLVLDDIASILCEQQHFPTEFEYSEYAKLLIHTCDELDFRNRLLNNTMTAYGSLQALFYDLAACRPCC